MKKLAVTTHFTTGAIEDIIVKDDATNFRWTRKYFGLPNGLNFLSEKKEEENHITFTYEYFNGLILTVNRQISDCEIKERYTLSNPTEKAVETDDSCSIGLTFADDLDIAEVALKRRAYVRIFSGGNSFAVYNSKFNGDEDGVGVVLTDGVIGQVKNNKIIEKGLSIYDVCFPCKTLEPKEEYSFEWLIFAFENIDEFISTVRKYQPFPAFSAYPLIKGQTVQISSKDELFIDGIKAEKGCITLDKPMLIKVARKDRFYEFTLTPQSEEDYAKRLFVKSLKQSEKHIASLQNAQENPDKAKEILLDYFKRKNKKFFDIGMPIEIIRSDDELKKLFLKKAEYAILKDKGYYYPYQTLSKYDYLKKAYTINPDPRYLDKLDELEKLRNAIFRLWW